MKKLKFLSMSLCLFVAIPKTEAQFQRMIFRFVAKQLIKSLFSDDDDKGKKVRENNVKAIYSEIDEAQDKRLGQLESQVLDINNKLVAHNGRITELEEDQLAGNFGLGIGMGNIDGEVYQPMTTVATLNYDEASVGLYLNVHNFNEPVNTKLDRETMKLTNILSYARFGSEDSPAYASFGSVNTSSFGNNFLFRNYSNDVIYNDRQLGFKAGLSHSFIGVELMSSDLSNNRIKVGRVSCKPLVMIDDNATNTSFSNSTVAFNYVYDKDITGRDVKIQAFDAQIPVFTQVESDKHTLVNLFGNYAKVENAGTGYGVGLMVQFLQEGFGISGAYEYRQLDKNFSTKLFDPFYELGRYERRYSNYEGLINVGQARQEQSISLECHLKMLHLSGNFVSALSNDANQALVEKGFVHLQALLSVPIQMEETKAKIEAAISLDQRNLNSLNDVTLSNLTNNNDFNSILSFSSAVNVPIGEQFDIFAKYQYRDFFQKNDANNQLKKINQSVLSLGLSYNFGKSNNN